MLFVETATVQHQINVWVVTLDTIIMEMELAHQIRVAGLSMKLIHGLSGNVRRFVNLMNMLGKRSGVVLRVVPCLGFHLLITIMYWLVNPLVRTIVIFYIRMDLVFQLVHVLLCLNTIASILFVKIHAIQKASIFIAIDHVSKSVCHHFRLNLTR